MRMFDSPVTITVVTCLSCLVTAVNIYLIYVIWTNSPTAMGKFKFYMLKMSFQDLAFASCISFLFLPNLIFPLPGAIVVGLLKYFGAGGALWAYIITMVAGGMMMLAVNDCCLYRIFIFYKLERWIAFMSSKKALMHISFDYIAVSSFIGGLNYLYHATYQELVDYAKRHNLTEYMANIHPDTPVIAYDLERPVIIFSMSVIGLFLATTGGFNIWSNYAVHRKLMENKSSMSKESFRMQKSLTFILLAQAIIPGVSIATPVLIYEVTIFFSLVEIMQSAALEWFAVLLVGAYPFVNSIFCLYSMKPYWRFTKFLGRRILFCVKWSGEPIIIVEPTGSSSNQ